MSDLSIYALEDIVWDDFDRSGDHIVPHPNNNDDSEDKREGASCNKKPKHEPKPLQIKEERDPNTLNKETNLMEKDSWGGGVFAASGDTSKDMPSLQSGDGKISSNVTSGSELCTDDGIGKDSNSGVGDNNSYNYPPSHNNIRQPDLNLFSNDKESSDLLYYGWPDIGNFDDMDRMLSNCDSSFGLGVTGNDDELVWFTSEDPSGGYEDLKFPCTSPQESDNNKKPRIVSESKDEFKSKDNHNNNNNKGLNVSYMQNTNYLHPGGAMMTGTKFEKMGPTPTPTPSSIESSQVQSIEGYGDPLLYGRFQTQVSSEKEFYVPENKIESQSQSQNQNDIVGVKKRSLGELDVPEGSSISTELDEISLEATSFRQLHQVMEQLDLRTKLCIRDSLYRLAKSAEQRHNHAGITDPTNPSGPLMTDGTNNGGFMDMETDTNPIDRTIAHLLFHRPSESFNMPTTPSPLKPNAKETRNESDDKVSSCGKN